MRLSDMPDDGVHIGFLAGFKMVEKYIDRLGVACLVRLLLGFRKVISNW